jgi:Zn-dependent peptidase ImmA (M78 family)
MPSRAQAEKEARDLLQRTWAADLESCPLPIDAFYIASQLQLEVVAVPLEPDVSGMLMKNSADEPPVIFVNSRDHLNRQRFSAAHELGHYFERTRAPGGDTSWGYIDRRGPSASEGRDPSEIHANAFAAELLMPAERVRSLRRTGTSLSRMAAEFGVSTQAMSNRVDNLERSRG